MRAPPAWSASGRTAWSRRSPPSAPANILSLVQSVNAQRLEKYQQIAEQKGVPVEQVGAIAGEKIIGKLKPGWYYMDASGNWVQK